MLVVSKIRRGLRGIDPCEVNRQLIRDMGSIHHGHGDGAVTVDVGANIERFDITRGLDAHRPGPREAEVARERPQPGRDEVAVAIQADQGVVARRVLRAPPVRVA